MKIQRILLSAFLTVLCVFLTGYIKAENDHSSAPTKQKPVVEIKIPNNTKAVKGSQKKVTKKKKAVIAKLTHITGKSDLAKQTELQKPLDLSLPYKDIENSDLVTEQKTGAQSRETNIFASENRKKTRALQVDGRLLTSQEPEVEKQKSAEGAGIVINLKP